MAIYLLSIRPNIFFLTNTEKEKPQARPGTFDPLFFEELSAYLTANRLEQLLGLRVLEERLDPQLQMEFVIADQATVMIKREHAAKSDIYRVTGWVFAHEVDGSISVKGKETHASQNGVHKIFTDGKLKTFDAGLNFLIQKGAIKNNPRLEPHGDLSQGFR